MKRRGLIAVGAGLYAIVLVATAPATWLDRGLSDATGGSLRLTQARGNLWSGSGRLESRDSRGRAGPSEQLAWRLLPRGLLGAGLSYRIELASGLRAFPATLSWSGLEVANAEFSLPAAALGLFLPRLEPLGLGGEVHVQIPRLAIAPGTARGHAALQWRSAGSALTPVSPLGDYELRVEANGFKGRSTLTTLHGPLQLAGRGEWAQGQPSRFVASARMPPALGPQLAPLLRLVAVEQRDGSFEWRLR